MRLTKEDGQYRFHTDDPTAGLTDLYRAPASGQSAPGHFVPGEHQVKVLQV
jgi:hypothetical protein